MNNLYLQWALSSSREMKTHVLRLAEGQSQVVAFDYFMDHCARQWEHRIFRRDGLLFAEQWTADYGHDAELAMGLYINGCKLRKGEVRQIPDGAVIYQLSWYTKKILHFSLSALCERSPDTLRIA
jgi:hypothetical protein